MTQPWVPPVSSTWNDVTLLKRIGLDHDMTFSEGDQNKSDAENAINWLGQHVLSLISGNPGFYTGDVKITFETDVMAGWLLCDDRTIGTIASNSDIKGDVLKPLYKCIWKFATDVDFLTSLGGATTKGVSSDADWNANKRLHLPDPRGRVLVSSGQGPGLTNRILGQKFGSETDTLAHSHGINVSASGPITIPALTVSVTSISASTSVGTRSLSIDPYIPAGTINTSALQTIATNTGTQALTIGNTGAVLNPTFIGNPVGTTPAGTITLPAIDPIGLGTLNTAVSAITVTNVTGSTAPTISGSGSVSSTFAATPFTVTYVPTGTNTAPGLGTLNTNVSGVTVANTTGATSPSISGIGTLNPTVTVGIPGNGTLNTAITAVTVANTTGATAPTISGSGTVTSSSKTGVLASPQICSLVTMGDATVNVASCTINSILVNPFTVDTPGSTIAAALTASSHTHSIPALAVTVTQGITGALTAPTATSSITGSTIAAALTVGSHTHTIPALSITMTQGLTGSLAAPVWTATNSLSQNVTVVGTVTTDAADIAAKLTVGSHTHTIPALTVTVTQGLTGALATPTYSGSATFAGTPTTITATGTVSITSAAIAATLTVSPSTHSHTIPALTVSGTATFSGTSAILTGTVDVGGITVTGTGSGSTTPQDISVNIPVVGNTDSSSPTYSLVQPSIVVNFLIKI